MVEQALVNQGIVHSSTHIPHSASVHADLPWHRRGEEAHRRGATLPILNVKAVGSLQQFKILSARLRALKTEK